jgi:hypothetical protein
LWPGAGGKWQHGKEVLSTGGFHSRFGADFTEVLLCDLISNSRRRDAEILHPCHAKGFQD